MNCIKSLVITVCLCGLAGSVKAARPDTEWTYKEVDGKKLQMSVFLPDGYAEADGPFPTFVVFHGGSWRTGTPDMHYPDCEYWSRRGMIAVSVDYRLKDRDQVDVPLECVKDAKSAVRYLRAHAERLKVDPNRLVVAGGSAGGQMAAATAMIHTPDTNTDGEDLSVSCIPDAVILYNPYWVTGCTPGLTPSNFVVKDLPPMISFLGAKDSAIPVDIMLAFHHALKEKGNVSEFYVAKDGKHGFCNGRNPGNPFFYWSLELQDRFLFRHGILSGKRAVLIPEGVAVLSPADFETFD